MKPATLSIVVPAYNEEASISAVVGDLVAVAPSCALEFEILVVDDGSRDRTPAIAEELARRHRVVRVFRHPVNRGFGAAFRTGIENARGEYLALVPADGQFPPEDLCRLLRPLPCDVVLGYRDARRDPPARRWATLLLRGVMAVGFGVPFRDINWIKLCRRDFLLRIRLGCSGIGIDAELVVKSLRAGAKIREAPVRYLPRRFGEPTGGRPRRVIGALLEIGRLWWWRYGIHLSSLRRAGSGLESPSP